MNNEAFVAFWVGITGGFILGIVLSAIFVSVANRIERGEQ